MGSSFWSRAAGAGPVCSLSRCPRTHSPTVQVVQQTRANSDSDLARTQQSKGRGSDITGDRNAGLRLARVGLGWCARTQQRAGGGGEAVECGGQGGIAKTTLSGSLFDDKLHSLSLPSAFSLDSQPWIWRNNPIFPLDGAELCTSQPTLPKTLHAKRAQHYLPCAIALGISRAHARSNKHRPAHKLASFHQPRAHHVKTTVLHTSRQWESCRYSRVRKTRKLSTRSPARRPGSWSTSALGI
ncbi:hypothetical protein IWZ03DRAFT_365837 [Phyllosticta citriasiana]|uniref:Uncharacterized protein n=1 Tax=Phyllosticta citriasiana TaxID=595635 RepID=A0ABR1KYG3_9PEZI